MSTTDKEPVRMTHAEGRAIRAVRRVQAIRRFGEGMKDSIAGTMVDACDELARAMEDLLREHVPAVPCSIKVNDALLRAMVLNAAQANHADMLLEQDMTGVVTLSQSLTPPAGATRGLHAPAVAPVEPEAWGDFLWARTSAIHSARAQGATFEGIAYVLSLQDAAHVERIFNATGGKETSA